MLSVALSLGLLPLGVTQHPALWSSDFPRVAFATRGRLWHSGSRRIHPLMPGLILGSGPPRIKGCSLLYQVSADTCGVEVIKINLDENFQPKIEEILSGANERSKILFICSPNNPSGNAIESGLILNLINNFKGIVVVDEAYSDFSKQPSCSEWIGTFPNLVVMQTFSKAWGLAGIRLGMAFASKEIIYLMNKVKPPYNVNQLTQQAALVALKNVEKKNEQVAEILEQRGKMAEILRGLDVVEKVYPSDANFLLVKVRQANALYNYLLKKEVVVRNRHTVVLCEDCLRITVGVPSENARLVKALKDAAFQFA